MSTHDPAVRIWRRLEQFVDMVAAAISGVYMNGRISWYLAYLLAAFVVVRILSTL